jgi:hypothetical protein
MVRPKVPTAIHSHVRRFQATLCVAAFAIVLRASAWQQNHAMPMAPLPEKPGPLRKALLPLCESKTAEARKELEEQRQQGPGDADVLYQIARSYLLDFYGSQDPEQRRVSLSLAIETLGDVLNGNGTAAWGDIDGTFADVTNFVGFAQPGNKGHGVAFIDDDDMSRSGRE